MKLFYSKYTGLTLGWGDCCKTGWPEHRWNYDNYISISFTGNNIWRNWGWRCLIEWRLFRELLADIHWLPWAHTLWHEHQIARETYYYWLGLKLFIEIEALENVKARWIRN